MRKTSSDLFSYANIFIVESVIRTATRISTEEVVHLVLVKRKIAVVRTRFVVGYVKLAGVTACLMLFSVF